MQDITFDANIFGHQYSNMDKLASCSISQELRVLLLNMIEEAHMAGIASGRTAARREATLAASRTRAKARRVLERHIAPLLHGPVVEQAAAKVACELVLSAIADMQPSCTDVQGGAILAAVAAPLEAIINCSAKYGQRTNELVRKQLTAALRACGIPAQRTRSPRLSLAYTPEKGTVSTLRMTRSSRDSLVAALSF
mmetsp:Transcript_9623/g.18953  ORF Transcript_9623/g.18953 Transcript_9623/m.18953 type:complete len:196 (-) Transcript_9623:155-742(-)